MMNKLNPRYIYKQSIIHNYEKYFQFGWMFAVVAISLYIENAINSNSLEPVVAIILTALLVSLRRTFPFSDIKRTTNEEKPIQYE